MTDLFSTWLARTTETQRDVYKHVFGEFTTPEKVEWIKENVLAAEDELHELLGGVAWKSWCSDYGQRIDRDEVLAEAVDVLMFVGNLLVSLGVSDAELNKRYEIKLAKNRKRQDDGYSSLTDKCPGCRRALDDDATKCSRVENEIYCETTRNYYVA